MHLMGADCHVDDIVVGNMFHEFVLLFTSVGRDLEVVVADWLAGDLALRHCRDERYPTPHRLSLSVFSSPNSDLD